MGLAGQGNRARRADGYAMAALLVGLSVMSVLMSMALPVWSHMAKREREEELIWRGQQYARAIGLFQRKYANTFPPTLDVLVEQRFLRKKYKDPITNDDFQLIPAGSGASMPGMPGGRGGSPTPGMINPSTGFGGAAPPAVAAQPGGGPTATVQGATLNLGISGVVSKSKDASIKIYNGRQKYNEWAFVYLQTAQAINPQGGMPGMPGMPGGRGGPGGVGGRGGFPTPGGGPMPGGRGLGPFGPGGRGGMPPLPPGRGFQPIQPGGNQPPPFGMPQGQMPGQPMQPFGVPQKPPGD